ncbi:hypothetical protein JVT61DRAFT_9332 [Boletus reticuloceps]|uniref:Uncharacterized protein n=1 Tax=Boletus reticuloceps TaxID=495285 RepID=A0A8I2YGB4_9AGAM|nr:hypothetical protein JVT61DRAFT_9332 [Boletus reticuloceps]
MFSKKLLPSQPSSPPPQYSQNTQAPMASSKPSYCFWSRSLTVIQVQRDLNRDNDNKDENPSSSIVPQPRQPNKFQLGSRRSALEIFKEILLKTITLPFSSWSGKMFGFSTTVTSDKLFLSNLPCLHLLSVVHRKRKLSSHKDEYLHMQVFNPSTKYAPSYIDTHMITHCACANSVVLHLVTQRLGTPEVAGPDYDKLHILSQADIADYSSGKEVCTLLCHLDAPPGSRPHFRDVIELLSVASELSASGRFCYNSHSFFAAAGILIIEDVYCTTPGLYTKRGRKGASKQSRKGELEYFVTAVERLFYGGRFRALRSESENQDALCPVIKAISGCLSRFAITLGLCE